MMLPSNDIARCRSHACQRWQSGVVDRSVDGIAEGKQALRRTMRHVRASVADRHGRTCRLWTDVLHLSGSIARELDRSIRVLAFVGVGNEPETDGLLRLLDSAGHIVLLPRVEGECIVAVVHGSGDELRSGAYGIPEPIGESAEPGTIDLVIVPGLAFTADGRRLGQGGGFYDRFLPQVRADCVTCGVGFVEQIVDDLLLEPHDRQLTMVLTA